MNSEKYSEKGPDVKRILEGFTLQGEVCQCRRYGNGHINDTYLLVLMEHGDEHRYILQRINDDIFKDPVSLMKNVEHVTSFLKKQIKARGGDPGRETLTMVPAKDGKKYYVDENGDYWRIYLFIEDSVCYDQVKKPEDFYKSGLAFGQFQRELALFPAGELMETIPDFHNTPARLAAFKRAAEADKCHRAGQVEKEIAFVRAREGELGCAMEMLERKELPLRVTHNDTKLNNIMFDEKTGEVLCIIDLDTIMPGLSIFDFGDSIRFGASTGAEDEKDLSKVSLSLELFELYTKGFLEGCGGKLTDKEVRMLPMGARLMTMENGIRFLTDYLEGDVYFHISYPEHNLDRCRTQFKLAADMEKKWERMEEIVRKYGGF